MKSLKLTMLAFLAGVATLAANAQDPDLRFFANPDNIEESDGLAEVNIWYDTTITNLNALQFDVYLPDGFTVEKDEDGYYDPVTNTAVSRDYTFTVALNEPQGEDPFYRFVGLSPQNRYLKAGNNRLVTFNIVVPSDFTAANYPSSAGVECRVANFVVAENADEVLRHEPEDFTFTIRPKGVPTGVTIIDAQEQGEDVIYNLQGIRVERPLAPGFYIINGEKTMVK